MSYDWLRTDQLEDTPAMVKAALALPASSRPETLAKAADTEWTEETSDVRLLWMNRVAQMAGLGIPSDPNRFRSWIRWGRPLIPDVEQPSFGDVILAKEEIGDIGVYIGEDTEAFHFLTRTAGEMSINRMERGDFWTARRPAYEEIPATVVPVELFKNGGLKGA